MVIYAGLDVSDKQTHICVVDGDGAVGLAGPVAPVIAGCCGGAVSISR